MRDGLDETGIYKKHFGIFVSLQYSFVLVMRLKDLGKGLLVCELDWVGWVGAC